MRWVITPLILVATALGLLTSHGALARAEPVRVAGQDYARVSDWARANGLEVRWLKRDETLQLSGRGAKVVLTVDSREAQFNGLSVWLSFPVIERSGVPCLSQAEMQATFLPLLTPPKNRAGVRLKTICLDPGHGGRDPGLCVGSKQEKKYTLLLAQELGAQLRKAGWKVCFTRSSDRYVDLPERPELAGSQHADLFISLHFNATENSAASVHGTQVFCLTPPGARSTNAQGEGADTSACTGNRNNDRNLFLAYQVQKALVQNLSLEDRGVRRARFAVLRDATMPAVLVEAAFMSHPVEGRKIFTAAYRRQLAQAIAAGVAAYQRQVTPGA